MKYVIYARKSSESEDRQALSIQSQIIEMQEIARRDQVPVIKIFQEAKSSKAPGRPVFNEMIKFIQSGKAQGILCWKIDRLARNPVDEGILKWMLQNSVIQQIKTFERDYNPEDNVVLASIEFSMANQYIRDLSRNVKRGLAERVRRGEYPAAPPLGYARDYKTRHMAPDTEVAPFVKKAFTLYAEGHQTVKTIAKQLHKDGFRSKLGNKVGKSTIYRILTNPIYTGQFRWKGEPHQGVHDPIVSHALFDTVGNLLNPRQHLKLVQNKRVFTYRGFLVCGECGLKVTAETQKGHVYYRCTKSKGTHQCAQRYTREEDIERILGKELERIRFDEDVLNLIMKASKESLKEKEKIGEETKTRLTNLLDTVKKRKSSLVEKFIDNAISKEIYDEKFSEIFTEEASLTERIGNVKHADTNLVQGIETAVRFVKTAHDLFNRGAPETRREVIDILSSNIGIKDRRIAYIKLNEPFSWIREDTETLKAEICAFEPENGRDNGMDKTKTEAGASVCSVRRKGWDSNPRYRFRYNSFRDCPIRPL